MAHNSSHSSYNTPPVNSNHIKELQHDDLAFASDDAERCVSTVLSLHAQRQAQRRGIGSRTIDLILIHHDRSRKLPGRCRAIWISRKGRERLTRGGYFPSEIDRIAGIQIIIDLRDDVAVTVEHSVRRRAWA